MLLRRGLDLELLEGQRVLAELLEDAEQPSVGGRVFGAEFLEVISIEASDKMIELSDTDMENGLVELSRLRALQ